MTLRPVYSNVRRIIPILAAIAGFTVPAAGNARLACEIWARVIEVGNPQLSYASSVACIATDSQANIYAGINRMDNEIFPSQSAFLVKVDPNGNLLWSRSYCGFSDAMQLIVDVEVDNSGNVVIVGSRGSFGLPFMAKYGSDGTVIWGTPFIASAKAIAIAPDNSIVGCGGSENLFVSRVSPTGDSVWTGYYPSATYWIQCVANDVIIDDDGHVVIVGTIFDDINRKSDSDWLVRKYTITGTPIWTDERGGGLMDGAGLIKKDPYGFYLVFGWKDSGDPTNSPVYLRKYYKLGSVWGEYALSVEHIATGAVSQADGTFVLSDFLSIAGFNTGYSNVWAVKVSGPSSSGDSGSLDGIGVIYALSNDSNGSVIAGGENGWTYERKAAIVKLRPTAECFNELMIAREAKPVIYPNPAAGNTATIALDIHDDLSTLEIRVCNTIGETVLSQDLSNVTKLESAITLNGLGAWAPGLYIIRAKGKYADGTAYEPPNFRLMIKR